MPEDEVSQSFKRAGEAFERMPHKPFRLPFPTLKPPQAPAQMSKWFNTTSGFVTGIFGGLLMVTVTSAVVSAVVFIVFIAGFFVISQVSMRVEHVKCINEYMREQSSYVTEAVKEQCNAKVGLATAPSKKDKGYW